MKRKTFYSLIAGVLFIGGIIVASLGFSNKQASADTFGYPVIGASDQGLGETGTMLCMPFTSPAGSNQVDSMGAYIKASDTNQIKGVIVLAADQTIIANGVGGAVNAGTAGGAWSTSTFSTPPTLTASTGYFVCFVQNGGGTFSISYDDGDWNSGEITDSTNSYTTPTDPTDATPSDFGGYYSIYATLSEVVVGGGEDYIPKQNNTIIIQ